MALEWDGIVPELESEQETGLFGSISAPSFFELVAFGAWMLLGHGYVPMGRDFGLLAIPFVPEKSHLV